jgi:glycosyltransferase involved in cell wall biosynthesis
MVGWVTALGFLVVLFTTPLILVTGLSALGEIPTISFSLCALAVFDQADRVSKPTFIRMLLFCLSGILLGLSILSKAIVVILLAAIILTVSFDVLRCTNRDRGLAHLLTVENVVWLGPKPYIQIPAYLARFTVATIPFKVNNITLSTSPIKLFEYMAAGKPIVTTAMPECRKYDGVLVADSRGEFIEHLDKTIKNYPNPNLIARLQAEAQRNTWAIRAEQMLTAISTFK